MIAKKHIRSMSYPVISIVMAAKNEAMYIAECIDSIKKQTFEDWELIVIDDHSTDETALIIKEYSRHDKRIRYYISDGQRLNAALLTGQRHVRGKLLNRMDADDIMPSYKLQVMYDRWKENGSGHIVAGGTQHFVDEGMVGGGFKRYDAWLNRVAEKGSHWQEIYTECVIPSHCWLIEFNDFMKIGGFANTYPEDYDLCFRFYQAELTVIPVKRILHYWRDTQDRISRTWEEYKDNRFFEIKTKYFLKIDYDDKKNLIIWGAGRNGKDLIKQLKSHVHTIRWASNNPKKIGKDIYGITIEPEPKHLLPDSSQLLVAVTNEVERAEIQHNLSQSNLVEGQDYWFFI